MVEPRRAELDRTLGLGLSLLAAVIGVTCGSRATLEHGPIEPVVANAAGGPALQSPSRIGAAPAEPSAVANAPPASVPALPPRDPTLLDLPHFYAGLAELEQHRRAAPVRIVWLGDSHTAADYLTGSVRARLQARFGAGGPGFVRVGVKPYRHTQLRWANDGAWKIEPVPPSRRTPFDDGVFGLGGIRALPDGAPAQASFEVARGTAHGSLHWQLWFALPDGASFRVTLAGTAQVVTRASAPAELPQASFSSLALESGLEDKFELVTLAGAPRFYGLIVEGSEPGVVLDTVGIDGARVATALAWSEDSFEAALKARAPSLVAIAFGTNEAFDADRLEKYRAQYRVLLGRLRVAAPDTDCLILGPPDANATSGGSEPRVAQLDELQSSIAAELGCSYLSQLQIMGGPGAYTAWAHKTPPLAHGDRLHLSAKGYEVVANAIADRLLQAYEKRAR